MNGRCTHLDRIRDVTPSSWGCEDCLAQGRRDWVHLRVCQECGHVGCCDNSPGRHATAHFRLAEHPVIRSYEPGEDWYWCYVDQFAFERNRRKLELQKIIFELKNSGIGILMTDHNVRETLAVTDRAYIINNGRIFRSGSPESLGNDPEVRRVYLGENFSMGLERERLPRLD